MRAKSLVMSRAYSGRPNEGQAPAPERNDATAMAASAMMRRCGKRSS
jgi:hypothetical protein